jgi:hypothetical protein
MTRYSLATGIVATMLCLWSTAWAQLQNLPLASPTGPYQTTGAPGEAFPSFNIPSPTFSSFNTSTVGGYSPVPASGTVLQQLYPMPSNPLVNTMGATGPAAATVPGTTPPAPGALGAGLPLTLREVNYQNVLPPDVLAPGLATIKDGKWITSDFFYNLGGNIGVRVEILAPPEQNLFINGDSIEQRVKGILETGNIMTEAADVSCEPPLPMFHVFIMAYACHNRCVAFITAQLFEKGKPDRFELDINGLWQMITWQRQTLVASSCDNFHTEVSDAVGAITQSFADRYKLYHPVDEIPCFNVTGQSPLPPPRPIPPRLRYD